MIETACPSRETLVRYLQGQFDLAQIDSLEEHLDACPRCEETVSALEDTNDTLMRHLPLAASDKAEAEAEAPVWIERLKVGPPTQQDEPAGQRTIDGQGESAAKDWADGLASYELLEVLGKGGMGVVYRGRHRQLGRPVAVKVVRPQLFSAAEAQRRFDREIQILGGLNHPGIVMATDAGRVGPAAYLVMELIDGVDLAKLVRTAGPLDVGEACEVARQIAVALSAAHAAGAVHRDVKPSNVMIDAGGRVKLLDFGLACLIDLRGEHGETSLGRLLGTLDYMAPEQAEGIRVQSSADLYGLGATLFYLLAGRPPHGSDRYRTLLGQLKALSCEDPPRLADVRLDVPEELSHLVARLLARNPAERPETAAEVADCLATWADPDAKRALAAMIPAVDRTDDVQAAAQSLAALVGGEPEDEAREPRVIAQRGANGGGRRIGRWLLGLAGFAAAALGIVLLVKTPAGTLRIESEADNVQVELVDEADRTTTLHIDQGENATELRAGNYRIRLADKHDNLSLAPDAIELRRGEEQVARITQLPPDVSEQQDATGGSRPSEPGVSALNEELTHVVIRLEYEDGRPATGAEASMSMQANSDRPVVVTGKADAQGVAFNRNLPYGKYVMRVKVTESDGSFWSASLPDILLEFGGSYEQKVVVPDPDERATMEIHAAFNPAGLAGLHFGIEHAGGRVRFDRGHSPEPGEDSGRFASFPVPGHGISLVGLNLLMRLTREVKQPSDEVLQWRWQRRADWYPDQLIVTDEGVIDPQERSGDGAYNLRVGEYFSNPRPRGFGISYRTFKYRQRTDNPLSLTFPPGQLKCELTSFLGKATDDVIQVLGLEPQGEREVWLEAAMSGESAWVPRGIDLSDWSRGQDINVLARRERRASSSELNRACIMLFKARFFGGPQHDFLQIFEPRIAANEAEKHDFLIDARLRTGSETPGRIAPTWSSAPFRGDSRDSRFLRKVQSSNSGRLLQFSGPRNTRNGAKGMSASGFRVLSRVSRVCIDSETCKKSN